jgi:hypothetical protein
MAVTGTQLPLVDDHVREQDEIKSKSGAVQWPGGETPYWTGVSCHVRVTPRSVEAIWSWQPWAVMMITRELTETVLDPHCK